MDIKLEFFWHNKNVASLGASECLEASMTKNLSDASLLLELERYPWVSQIDAVGFDDPTNPSNYLMFYVEKIDIGLTASIVAKHVFFWNLDQIVPDPREYNPNKITFPEILQEPHFEHLVGWEFIPPEDGLVFMSSDSLQDPPSEWRLLIYFMQGLAADPETLYNNIIYLQPQMSREGRHPKVYANMRPLEGSWCRTRAPKLPGNRPITDKDPNTKIQQTVKPLIVYDQMLAFFDLNLWDDIGKKMPYGPPEKGLFYDREKWAEDLCRYKGLDETSTSIPHYVIEAHLHEERTGRFLSGSERSCNPLVYIRDEPMTEPKDGKPRALAIKSVEDWLDFAAAERRKMLRWLKKQPTERLTFSVQTPTAYTYTPSMPVTVSAYSKDYEAIVQTVSIDLKDITNGNLELLHPQGPPNWKEFRCDFDTSNGEDKRQVWTNIYTDDSKTPDPLFLKAWLLDWDGGWQNWENAFSQYWFNEETLRKMVENSYDKRII